MRYIFLIIITSLSVFSQTLFEPIEIIQDSNYFRTITNKHQNIYNFYDDLLYSKQSKFGNFLILQNYSGQGTPLTNSSSFQESHKLRFNYEYELFSNLFAINKDNWFISSNTLNFGLNKLERLNFLLGGKYQFLGNSFLELGYGKERNTTVGIEEYGEYYYGNFKLTPYNISKILLKSNGYADIVNLEDGRTNFDLNFNLFSKKEFDENSSISLNVDYQGRNRDNPELTPGLTEIPIRRRKSDKVYITTYLNFKLAENIDNTVSFGFNNEFIGNSFFHKYQQITESNYKREVNIFDFDFTNSLNYYLKDAFFYTYINYHRSNEDFSALNILNLPSNQFSLYKENQNRQDKLESFFNIKLNGLFSLSMTDSLSFGIDYRLRRYDTPSENNNDDRDELSLSGDIEYLKKISPILSVGVRNEFRLFHYVYLKSQRSSSNNWNRVLRLAPTILIKSKSLYYKPLFAINVNYTTYDFENIVTGINSFSFREISYLDSLQIKLYKKFFLEAKNEVRYSERGILYWNEFAEQPQRANLELFLRNLLFYRNEMINLGIGARFFKRKDVKINELIIQNNIVLNDFQSLAPEIVIEYVFDSGNILNFDIWYEFQEINENTKNQLVNFYLSTNIRL